MSENEKNPPLGESINEEQLDAVSGGSPKYGTVCNPKLDTCCWFRQGSEPREDGRILCRSECKGILEGGRPVDWDKANDIYSWYICHCWGSDYCIDRWHKPCGKPARTAW